MHKFVSNGHDGTHTLNVFIICHLFYVIQPKRATLELVKEESDIADLSVRQLREILACNFVNYRGCCEKWELVDRVKRLWTSKESDRLKGRKTLCSCSCA